MWLSMIMRGIPERKAVDCFNLKQKSEFIIAVYYLIRIILMGCVRFSVSDFNQIQLVPDFNDSARTLI